MSINPKCYLMSSLLSLAMFAPSVDAEQLLVTSESAKSANSNLISLDVESSGLAAGLQFKIKVPAGVKVDTKNCLADLPKSHDGVCEYNQQKGYVVGLVFSDTNALLPKGIVSIGRIKFSGELAKSVGAVEFLAADKVGNDMQSSVNLNNDTTMIK